MDRAGVVPDHQIADPVLEERLPADGMRSGKLTIGESELHQIVDGLFGRAMPVRRPSGRECRIEHRRCPRPDAEDELVEMLEDVVDRSDSATDLARGAVGL